MDEQKRLELIVEAVLYCQRVRTLGMPPACYSKALREPVHFLWERRTGSKIQAATFRSRQAAGLSFGSGLLVYDHAVPFRYLQGRLLKLEDVSIQSVRTVLDEFGAVVLITKLEDDRLNAAGYKSRMPDDWDERDSLARYRAVGIELVQNAKASI